MLPGPVRSSDDPNAAAMRGASVVVAVMSVALLGYTTLRAGLLAYTFDESNTFLLHVPLSFWSIVTARLPSANNHVINTLLTKVAYVWFGGSELALRSPNLLAHAIYLAASFAIVRRLRDPVLVVAGFVVLNSNPFLLDHFSISRGYGIGLAFMLLSIALILRAMREPLSNARSLAFAAATIAVLANFTLANFYAGLVAAWYLAFAARAAKERLRGRRLLIEFLRDSVPVVASLGILFLFSYDALESLVLTARFYFGGTSSFFEDTIGTTLDAALYGAVPPGPLFELIRFGIVAVGFGASICAAAKLASHGMGAFRSPLFVAWLLLFVPILSTIVLHHAFDTPYLIARTALFLLPLFGLSAVLVAGDMASRYPAAARTLLVSIAAAGLLGLAAGANLSRTFEWSFNADTRAVLDDLEASRSATSPPVRLGVDWLFRPSVDFYVTTRNLDWIAEVDGERRVDNRRKCGGACTHYYVFTREGEPPGDEMGRYERLAMGALDLLVYYPETDTLLLGTPLR